MVRDPNTYRAWRRNNKLTMPIVVIPRYDNHHPLTIEMMPASRYICADRWRVGKTHKDGRNGWAFSGDRSNNSNRPRIRVRTGKLYAHWPHAVVTPSKNMRKQRKWELAAGKNESLRETFMGWMS